MLLVELRQVECAEDLISLSLNTTSIAEFQGRWVFGLWAGRFINERKTITMQAGSDEYAYMLTEPRLHVR